MPGDTEASYLVDLITPTDGQAEMPQGKAPLSETDRQTIVAWITQGAKDDTPESAQAQFDAEHPPTYVRPPPC